MQRKLFVTLGEPGSGKSTWIKNNKLEDFTIASDAIRLLFGSYSMEVDGIKINDHYEKKVWQFIYDLLDNRLKKGIFTIFDATNTRVSVWQKLLNYANRNNTEVYAVDFTGVPVGELLLRNNRRPKHQIVSEDVIKRMNQNVQNIKLPKTVNIITPAEAVKLMQLNIVDASQYKRIHHIGDIHGCYDALVGFLQKTPITDDELFIFTGDFVDRGNKHTDTLRLIHSIAHQPNVILLEGNHEQHLRHWSRSEKSNSREFERFTKFDLEKNGMSRSQVSYIVKKLHTQFAYMYNGKKVFVTHGGVPEMDFIDINWLSAEQSIRGVGKYEDDVDKIFSENHKDDDWYQVHGHRNIFSHPIKAGNKSFNLEGSVEDGGHLRVLTLTEKGFQERYFNNPDFTRDTSKEPTNIQPDLGRVLRENKGIQEYKKHHISSFNFKRKVFQKGKWDNQRIKARGLFLNNETNEIVARSYDKFFNINEKNNTLEELRNKVDMPLTLYKKENGFLGIVGVDRKRDSLLLASKRMTSGKYAELFKRIFDKSINPDKERDLLRYLDKQNLSLVFEVIDSIADPHIIRYDRKKLVLLDAVHRDPEFKKVPYHTLKMIGKDLGVEVKEKFREFTTFDEFEKWLEEKMNVNPLTLTKDNLTDYLEGYVAEDANGYHFKIKLPYYAFWKWVRSQSELLLNRKELSNKFVTDPYGSQIAPLLEKVDKKWLKESSFLDVIDRLLSENPLKK